jgi:asparagine synthetase B (glutamine-hydrolysing)
MTETMQQIRNRVKAAQANYGLNLSVLDLLLKNERGYASRSPENEDVVVLMSGGLDSTVMIQRAIENYRVRVHPLFVRRGARAEKHEEKAFDFFVKFYQKRFPENFMEPRKLDYEVPPAELKADFPAALAKTVGHPMRNATLQNLAVMYAVSLQAKGLNIKNLLLISFVQSSF